MSSSANQSARVKGKLEQYTRSAENYFNNILGRESLNSEENESQQKPEK